LTETYLELQAKEIGQLFDAFAQGPIGMVVLEGDGQIVRTNSSFCDFTGYSQEEIIQLGLDSLIYEEDFIVIQSSFQKLAVGGLDHFQLEKRFVHKNGNVVWGSISAHKANISEANYIIAQVVNITPRIQEAEELMIQSEKLSIAGQLSAAIAHEIRNPITAIKGFLKLLQNSNEKQLYYEIVESEIARIELILSELLSLAKPQKNNFKETDLRLIIKQSISLLDAEANMKSVQVDLKHEENLPTFHCDENQMKQVFINFMKNAFDAMPDGGSLNIEMEHDALTSGITIRFKDTGCGIPMDILSKIGQPFYTTKEKGTGLGFMVSKNIIEGHSGTVHISSEINVGTTVEVVLPGISIMK
jgi:PAS domain S-box-containing protein